jgi:dTDP-4-dehydrorhamnose reductase
VFDGRQGTAYAETDATCPINLYGRQKVEAEEAVNAAAADEAVTIRAPLLMGNSATGRRSTHERLFVDWEAGRTPRLFTDEFRQTCTAENLAEVMVELCERRDLRGVFHWAGTELISRYALGERVRHHFKLLEKQAPLAPVTRADVPAVAAKRQARLGIDIRALAAKLKTRPQSIADQLEELHVPEPARAWYHSLG